MNSLGRSVALSHSKTQTMLSLASQIVVNRGRLFLNYYSYLGREVARDETIALCFKVVQHWDECSHTISVAVKATEREVGAFQQPFNK